MRKLKRPHEGMADPGEAAAASFLAVGECPSPIARRKDPKVCVYCGGREYVYNGAVDGDRGSRICVECGAVADEPIFWETRYGRSVPLKGSNYKRIHHWHERISQFMLQETSIPPDRMLEIGRRLLDGSHSSINKDSIRAVLRSLNYQTYIEKWMQIAFAVLGLPPPYFSQQLIWRMDEVFQSLQEPFTAAKPDGRTNFLNYNYTPSAASSSCSVRPSTACSFRSSSRRPNCASWTRSGSRCVIIWAWRSKLWHQWSHSRCHFTEPALY